MVVLFKIDVSVSSISPVNLECLNGLLKFCKSEMCIHDSLGNGSVKIK